MIPFCLRLSIHERKKCIWESIDQNNFSPLPDPSLSLDLHSVEAQVRSAVLLRRFSMMKTVRSLVTGKSLSLDKLMTFLGNSDCDMHELPFWWNPQVHDVALLLCAAKHGLFSVLHLRKTANPNLPVKVFAKDVVALHIRSIFTNETNKTLPEQVYKQKDLLDAWVVQQASIFPTWQVVERRIARICKHFAGPAVSGRDESIFVYNNFPMFDHYM